MHTKVITTYKELNNFINELNHKYAGNILFRAEPNCLVPSLISKLSTGTVADWQTKEDALLADFITKVAETLPSLYPIPLNWRQRIKGREHGLASSLMDWSNYINLALEFAIKDFESKSLAGTSIYVLVKDEINQIDINPRTTVRFDDIKEPTLINYCLPFDYHSHAFARRKFIQGGFFLRQPYDQIAIPVNSNPFFDNKLYHIYIPKEAVLEIRQALSQIIDLSQSATPKDDLDDLDDHCKNINDSHKTNA